MTPGETNQSQILAPHWVEGSSQPLKINSVLTELPRYDAQVSADWLGTDLATCFERYPDLPGVVMLDDSIFFGMISRQEFLEYLLRPEGPEMFLQKPIRVLYSYVRHRLIVLPGQTTIIAAAQQSLRRSPELSGHPIIVQQADQYLLLNVHDLNVAYWQLRGIETQVRYERAQAQMLQNEKMAALGRLVDGVAHEILDPIGFIWGNLSHVTHYSQQLLTLIDAYDAALPEKSADLEALEDDIELEYLKTDFPRIITSLQRGAERIKKLGASLQNFCHIDEVYPKPADLHDILDSIVLLVQSRLTTKIKITCEYESLPPVPCFAGQMSQVFMNILSDVIDRLLEQTIRRDLMAELDPAMAQSSVTVQHNVQHESPEIKITTRLCDRQEEAEATAVDRWVAITIADNGPGLPADVEDQVKTGFLQAKRAMKETSLSMSYRIITARHGGQFCVRSRTFAEQLPLSDASTEFEIRLPLYSSS